MPPLRVAKLGGSLLTWPLARSRQAGPSVASPAPLASALRDWLASQPPAATVLIVGGGERVDRLREQCQREPIGDAAAHWLAIEAMGLNTRAVAALLPEAPLLEHYEALTARLNIPGTILFDAASFLREIEPNRSGTRLPASWDVTSDAIAGRLAVVLGATELVLFKSLPPPAGASLNELASLAYVDRFLPRLEEELPPMRCVNLRTSDLVS